MSFMDVLNVFLQHSILLYSKDDAINITVHEHNQEERAVVQSKIQIKAEREWKVKWD